MAVTNDWYKLPDIVKENPNKRSILTPYLSIIFPPIGAPIPVNKANKVTIYPPVPLFNLRTFSPNWGKNTVPIRPQPAKKLKANVITICGLVKNFKFKIGSFTFFSIAINKGKDTKAIAKKGHTCSDLIEVKKSWNCKLVRAYINDAINTLKTPAPKISIFLDLDSFLFSSSLNARKSIIKLIGTFIKNKYPQLLLPASERIAVPKVGPITVAIPYIEPTKPRADPLFSGGKDAPIYAVAIGIIPPPPKACITLDINKNYNY